MFVRLIPTSGRWMALMKGPTRTSLKFMMNTWLDTAESSVYSANQLHYHRIKDGGDTVFWGLSDAVDGEKVSHDDNKYNWRS